MQATENNYQMKEVDLSAEIIKSWGKEWTAPELEYQFSNGRKFYRQPEDFGPYQP
jgi:hypothetical protein